MASSSFPRYQIVEQRPSRRGLWITLLVAAWLLTMLATWLLASHTAAPRYTETRLELAQANRRIHDQDAQLSSLTRRESNLGMSDRISRTANQELQESLAQRDEEITALRTDVAFYERLVGETAPRKGLSVHDAEFSRAGDGVWRYQIMLTQTLNRGAISEGQMRFIVEGVRKGQLATIDWDVLHQHNGSPGQTYSFRYFQQLDGSVMLPGDFTPQRVRVRLSGGDTPVEQALDWKLAVAAGGK